MRQPTIPTVTLPATSLEVSVLGLGTGGWGWSCPAADCEEVMDVYCDQGGNLIDSADVYPLDSNLSHRGLAEEIIGNWISKKRNRSKIILATKVGGVMGEGDSCKGLGREHILQAVDDSLRRLRTDYIDIYQTHWDDGTNPEDTLGAMADLVKAGKVRYIGCCSYSARRLLQCLEISSRYRIPPFRTLQLKVNLIDRGRLTKTLGSICATHNISILAYSPLAGGFLTGKYLDQNWRSTSKTDVIESRYLNDENSMLVKGMAAICESLGINLIEFCTHWVLGQNSVKVVLFGANSAAQLKAITASVGFLPISQAQVVRIFEDFLKERPESLGVASTQDGSPS
ncbi:MAG: aldo/keto reductase [Acidobacteria bacterium]|nr:aldo/keto reductase [Acidobacteriota bacterium]